MNITKEDAKAVNAVIEAWWQGRREAVAMDTETHNREAEAVADLKGRISALTKPAPATKPE